MKIRYTRLALEDIAAVRQYTEEYFDATQVQRILTLLETSVLHLAQFPDSGRTGRVHDTRELVVPRTPFVIVYRTRTTTLEVLAVIHTARQWMSL